MDSLSNDKVLNQLQEVFRAAIMLKERYDLGDTESVAKFTSDYLLKFEHLKDLLPEGMIDNSSLGKETGWIYSKRTNSKNNVRQICLLSIFLFQNEYLEMKIKKIKEEIESLL